MNHRSYSNEEVLREGRELILPGASTYSVSEKLQRPQTTIWWHVTHRLPHLDPQLYKKAILVLHNNSRRGDR